MDTGLLNQRVKLGFWRGQAGEAHFGAHVGAHLDFGHVPRNLSGKVRLDQAGETPWGPRRLVGALVGSCSLKSFGKSGFGRPSVREAY